MVVWEASGVLEAEASGAHLSAQMGDGLEAAAKDLEVHRGVAATVMAETVEEMGCWEDTEQRGAGEVGMAEAALEAAA